jgi:carbonic anhydrase
MTADEALERLLAGNARFVIGTPEHPRRDEARRAEQAGGQTPVAAVLSCSDSRVPPEIVFDQGIGDLFVVRIAGNTAADDITLGSLEFAIAVLGCPLLLVLGHEECGAVKAAVDSVVHGKEVHGHLAALVRPIVGAVEEVGTASPEALLDAVVKENVRRQVGSLAESFPAVTVVGARYDLHTGSAAMVSR